MHDLRVWKDVEGDGSINTTTPGKASRKEDQMGRLVKVRRFMCLLRVNSHGCLVFQLSRKHTEGHVPKVDWLDRLTFREIHLITEKHKRESNSLFLMIEFPRVHFDDTDYSVMYFEKVSLTLI